MKYDYLIVGAGLYGSVFCNQAVSKGKRCLVIDKRNHIGGNCYTENIDGINVHKYGPHIFHTNSKEVWDYINKFATFRSFYNAPIAIYKGQSYNLPFNMNTFAKIFCITTPSEAKERIKNDIDFVVTPSNLEEKAISMVGKTIYEMLIKGYTEKQWGRECKTLPPDIISRLPLRFTYDNNYFDDEYQGIPMEGYTEMIKHLLDGADVRLGVTFDKSMERYADTIVYTGKIDEYFGYLLGKLPYRSLNFEEIKLNTDNYQGNAVVNYTGKEVLYTRIVEHKFFDKTLPPLKHTIITKEYSVLHNDSNEPYYPIDIPENRRMYEKYCALAKGRKNLFFAGRAGEYRYYDMDDTIAKALKLANEILEGNG